LEIKGNSFMIGHILTLTQWIPSLETIAIEILAILGVGAEYLVYMSPSIKSLHITLVDDQPEGATAFCMYGMTRNINAYLSKLATLLHGLNGRRLLEVKIHNLVPMEFFRCILPNIPSLTYIKSWYCRLGDDILLWDISNRCTMEMDVRFLEGTAQVLVKAMNFIKFTNVHNLHTSIRQHTDVTDLLNFLTKAADWQLQRSFELRIYFEGEETICAFVDAIQDFCSILCDIIRSERKTLILHTSPTNERYSCWQLSEMMRSFKARGIDGYVTCDRHSCQLQFAAPKPLFDAVASLYYQLLTLMLAS
jgi:hypothetical protein